MVNSNSEKIIRVGMVNCASDFADRDILLRIDGLMLVINHVIGNSPLIET
jgi:hypothetical protein